MLALSLSHSARGFRSSQLPAEPRPLLRHFAISARLRCSTAWSMLRLARLRPGDVICDPMCGVGTIPLEAAATQPQVLALAGDKDASVVRQARANGAHLAEAVRTAVTAGLACLPLHDGPDAAPTTHCEERRYPLVATGCGVQACLWDATALPLRAGCVDAVVRCRFSTLHLCKTALSRCSVRVTAHLVVRPSAVVLAGGGSPIWNGA